MTAPPTALPTAPGRLPGLDLLRSLAIAWVMLFHTFLVGGLGPDGEWASRFGWMGVDLFFVLSGFLIGAQVMQPLARGQRLSFADFYARRAWRILPAYLAVLALYLAWPALREAPGIEPAWKFATFTLNLAIDYEHHAAFSHAWSLCVEEHFYWGFPLAVALLAALRAGPRTVAAITLAVVGAGIAWRAHAWLRDHAADPGMDLRNWFVEDLYYPTWCRLDGLLAGVLLAAWKCFRPASWDRARRHADLALVAGIAVLAVAMGLFRARTGLVANTVGWPVLSAAMAMLVFAGAGREGVIGRRALPGAAWLAGISYSLYLVHKAVYHLVQANLGAALEGHGALAFLAYGGASLAAGAALHHAVERPGLAWRDRHRARGAAALTRPA